MHTWDEIRVLTQVHYPQVEDLEKIAPQLLFDL